MIMKVFIKNRRTGLYFAGEGDWTANTDSAHNFNQSLTAIQYATENKLMDADLVYDFGSDRESIVMPILHGLPDQKPRPQASN
jgi:hypothetical protein